MKINHKKMNIVLVVVIVLMVGGFLYMQNSQKQVKNILQNQINDNLKVNKQSVCKKEATVKSDDENKQSNDPIYTEDIRGHRVDVYKKKNIQRIALWDFFYHELDLPQFAYFKGIGQSNNDCRAIIFYPYLAGHGYGQDIKVACQRAEKSGKILSESIYNIDVTYSGGHLKKESIINKSDVEKILNKIEI